MHIPTTVISNEFVRTCRYLKDFCMAFAFQMVQKGLFVKYICLHSDCFDIKQRDFLTFIQTIVRWMQKEYQNANKILNNIVVADNSRCSRVYFDNNKGDKKKISSDTRRRKKSGKKTASEINKCMWYKWLERLYIGT